MVKQTTLYIVFGAIILALVLLRLYARGRMSEGFAEGADEFVLYYADWCPHCVKVKPIFKSWGADKGSVQIGGKTVFVRMVEEQDMEKESKKPEVRGFPTFILRTADGKTKEFEGERNESGWEAWLKENL